MHKPKNVVCYTSNIYIYIILNKLFTTTFIPRVLWTTSTLNERSKYTQLRTAVLITTSKMYVEL